jgi:hypothetical protein
MGLTLIEAPTGCREPGSQRHTLVHQQVVGPLAPAPAHQPPAHDEAVADLGFAEGALVDHSGTAMEPFPESGVPGAPWRLEWGAAAVIHFDSGAG